MSDQSGPAASPTLATGALITAVIVAAITGWVFLGPLALGITSLYASFLFGWYWISMEHGVFRQWLPCLLGALLGLAFNWAVHMLAPKLGMPGALIAILVALAALIFVQVMNWLPVAVNRCTMLFITVLAAPALLEKMNFTEVAIAISGAAVYFAAVMKAVRLYTGRKR
jgi:hypothetical protein